MISGASVLLEACVVYGKSNVLRTGGIKYLGNYQDYMDLGPGLHVQGQNGSTTLLKTKGGNRKWQGLKH